MMLPEQVNILLIEDDSLDAEMFFRLMRKLKLANPVVHVTDGLEAIEVLLEEHPDKQVASPLLIVLDVNLPRMNGLEFLEALKDIPGSSAHRVFLMASTEADRALFAHYDALIDGYMCKSRMGETFSQCVDELKRLDHAFVSQ